MKAAKLIKKLHLENYLSARIVLLIDLVATLVASILSLTLIRLIFTSLQIVHPGTFTIEWLGTAAAVSLVFFYLLRTYRSVIRHSTLREIGRLTIASLGKATGMLLLLVLHPNVETWNFAYTALLVIDTMATIVLLILVRVAMFTAYNIIVMRMRRTKGRHILIYGTDDASVAMAQQLQNSSHYKVIGFLTYGRRLRNHAINGYRVYYFLTEENLAYVKEHFDADAVLFTSAKEARNEQHRLIRYAAQCNLGVLLTPPIDEVRGGVLNRNIAREVKIEDLLMRPEIEISMDKIRDNFHNKRVLVTGAAGSIGSELCRQLAKLGVSELIMFDNAETPMHNLRLKMQEQYPELRFTPIVGDVRQLPRLDFVFRTFKPEVVFHAAAYKHVPLMEENPCEAVLVNVVGSRNVADKCVEYDVEKMVMISTDKAVNPTNIMGTTKRLAEIYVQALGLAMASGKVAGKTRFVTTRFGNVLGSNGSVIPLFREQIAKGGPVTVTHPDITRFFMTIPEACRLVMEAATMSVGNEIFVFDMGESVRIADMARHMIELAGFIPEKDIKIEFTGLRPGEKLYEEVLANDENTQPTSHDRIRIADVREMDYTEALEVVNELETLAQEVNIMPMVRLMKRSVPEFKSENSKFKELDI